MSIELALTLLFGHVIESIPSGYLLARFLGRAEETLTKNLFRQN